MGTNDGVRVEVEFMGGPADGLVGKYPSGSLGETLVHLRYPAKSRKASRIDIYTIPKLDRGAMVPGFKIRARYQKSIDYR